MPNGNDNKVKVLYDAVSKDYSVGTYDEFSKKLQDPTKRKAFYDGVGKEYQLGSYDEFSNKIGAISDLKKKDGTQPSIQATAQPSKVGGVSSQSGGQQTPPSTSPLKSTLGSNFPIAKDPLGKEVTPSGISKESTAMGAPTSEIEQKNKLQEKSYEEQKKKDAFATAQKRVNTFYGVLSGKLPYTDITRTDFIGGAKDPSKIHEITDRAYDGTLTLDDLNTMNIANKAMLAEPQKTVDALNNMAKNIRKVTQLATTETSIPSLLQLSGIEKDIEHLENEKSILGAESLTKQGNYPKMLSDIDAKIKPLREKEAFIKHSQQAVYKTKYETEYKPNILKNIGDLDQFSDLYIDPKTNQIDALGQERIRRITDETMKKGGGDFTALIHEQGTGLLDKDNHVFLSDIHTQFNQTANQLIADLNTTLPIKAATKKYKDDYTKKYPELGGFLDSYDKIHNAINSKDKDAAMEFAKTSVHADILAVQDKFDSQLHQNPKAQEVYSKWDGQVKAGMVTPEIAQKNIERDLQNDKDISGLLKERKKEIDAINRKATGSYQDYITGVLKSHNPNMEIYPDGTVGIKGKSKEDSKKILEGYYKGLNDISNKTLQDIGKKKGENAEEIATKHGLFYTGLHQSTLNILNGTFQGIFNAVGIGGDYSKSLQSEMSVNDISPSKTIQELSNQKGVTAWLNPDYLGYQAGLNTPLMIGAAATSAATGGLGMIPSTIGGATFMTGVNLANRVSELSNTKDEFGNNIPTGEAVHIANVEAQTQFATNLSTMLLHSHLATGEAVAKQSIGKSLATFGKEQIPNALMMGAQGYLGEKAMAKAKGEDYNKNFIQYMLSDEGLAGLASMTPFLFMDAAKVMNNHIGGIKTWQNFLKSTDEGFLKNQQYNQSLRQLHTGNIESWIDAQQIRLFNGDYSSEAEKNELQSSLNYSKSIFKNLQAANLSHTNVNGLYAAHNLALGDIHTEYAKQKAEEGNTTLQKYHEEEAKKYREEAFKTLNGEGSFHYMVDATDNPVFISDKTLKTLTENGELPKWLKDNTVKEVVKSDDPQFSQKFKEQLAAQEEADKLLAQQKVEKPLTEDELSDLNKRKDDIEMILASDSASKQAGEGGNLVRGGREILSNELKDINEKLDAHKKAQSTDEETVRKAKDYDNRKNMVDAVFAKEDFFTPEEKKTFLTLDENAQDEMIDAKRKELKEIAQSDSNKDYEQNKADIEKRRQKELDDFHNPFNAQQHIKAYDEKSNLLSDTAESINAKYDAELAELEKSQQIKKVTPTIVVEGKEYYGANHGEAMKAAIADGKILATDKERNPITDIDSPELKDWRKKNGQFKTDSGKLIPRSEAQNKLGFSQSEDIPEGMLHVPEQPPTSEVSVPKEESEKEIVPVSSMIDKRGSYTNNKGETERGMFIQDGERIEFHTDKGNKIYELGSVKEIGNKDISEFNIKSEESKVGIADNGNITVSGKEYVNKYSDPLAAINRDADGNIISVNLETPNGEKRTFGKKDKQLAEDLAYQIHLKEITKDNANREQFEQFINEDGEASKTMEDGGLSETPETPTVKIDGKVSREKIEPIPITVNLKEPIIETVGEQTPLKDTSNIREQTEIETDESKGNKEADAKGQKNYEVKEGTGGQPPIHPIESELDLNGKEEPIEVSLQRSALLQQVQNDFFKPSDGSRSIGDDIVLNNAVNTLAQESIGTNKSIEQHLSDKVDGWYNQLFTPDGERRLDANGRPIQRAFTDEEEAMLGIHALKLEQKITETKLNPNDITDLGELGTLMEEQVKLQNLIAAATEAGGRALRYIQQIYRFSQNGEFEVYRKQANVIAGDDIPLDKEQFDKYKDKFPIKQQKVLQIVFDAMDKLKKGYDELKEKYSELSKKRDSLNDDEVQRQVKEAYEKGKKEGGNAKAIKEGKLTIEKQKEVSSALRKKFGIDKKTPPKDEGKTVEYKLDDAMKYIADEIDKGESKISDIVSNAVSKFKDKEISKENFEKDIKKELSDAGVDKALLDQKTKRDELVKKIVDSSKNSNIDTLSKDASKKGYISSLATELVSNGVSEPKTVMDDIAKILKENGIYTDRKDLNDAYLKKGKYKLNTLSEINNGEKTASQRIREIEQHESWMRDIDAKIKSVSDDNKLPLTEKETKLKELNRQKQYKEIEFKDALREKGLKLEYGSKESRAVKIAAIESYNNSIDELSKTATRLLNKGLLDKETDKSFKDLLTSLKSKLTHEIDATKLDLQLVKIAKNLAEFGIKFEKENRGARLANEEIRKIDSEIKRLKRELYPKEELESIKLKQFKKRMIAERDEWIRKRVAGEFDNTISKNDLELDADAYAIETEKNKVRNAFMKEMDAAIDAKAKKTLTGRIYLAVRGFRSVTGRMIVSGLGNIQGKLINSAIFRRLTPASRGLAFLYNKILGTEGISVQESSNPNAMWRGYRETILGTKPSKALEIMKETRNVFYDSAGALEAAEKEYRDIVEKTGGTDTKESIAFELGKLADARNNYKLASMNDAVAQMYDKMNPSALGSRLYILKTGLTKEEESTNLFKKQSRLSDVWKKDNVVDFGDDTNRFWNTVKSGGGTIYKGVKSGLFLANMVTRSHSIWKDIPARQAIVEGYMKRLENAQKNGLDIGLPSIQNKIWHDAVMNEGQSAKFQDKNVMAELTREIQRLPSQAVLKIGGDEYVAKTVDELCYMTTQVLKVPYNVAKTKIFQYQLGVFTGAIDYMMAASKAKESGLSVPEYLKTIDPKYTDRIISALSKGTVGAAVTILAGIMTKNGSLIMGGNYPDEKKKHVKLADGSYTDLEYGDIVVMGHKMPHWEAIGWGHTLLGYNMEMGNFVVDQAKLRGEKGEANLERWMDGILDATELTISSLPLPIPVQRDWDEHHTKIGLHPKSPYSGLGYFGAVKDIESGIDMFKSPEQKVKYAKEKDRTSVETIAFNSGLLFLVPTEKEAKQRKLKEEIERHHRAKEFKKAEKK